MALYNYEQLDETCSVVFLCSGRGGRGAVDNAKSFSNVGLFTLAEQTPRYHTFLISTRAVETKHRIIQFYVPYLLDQTPRLLIISSRNFVRLLFENGYCSRAAFIKPKGSKQMSFEKMQVRSKTSSFLTSRLFVAYTIPCVHTR